MPFTALEVNLRLFAFTRLPLEVTKAVAAFKREIMTASVRRLKLMRTHSYVDDVITGNRFRGETPRNSEELPENRLRF